MVRSWVWFIPITPPTNAFIAAINSIKFMFFCGRRKAKIDRGASFCQEDKIKQDTHEIEDMTDGYQKWHGTLPNFSIIAAISVRGKNFERGENVIHIDVLDISSRADPSAWARKYFTAPSVSWLLFDCIIMGTNLNRFSSMAPQRNIQLALDIAITVLNTSVDIARAIVGDLMYCIRLWRNWTP